MNDQVNNTDASHAVARLREACLDRLWLGATMTYGANTRGDLAKRRKLADKLGSELAGVLLGGNRAALQVADRGYVLETGRVTLEGDAGALAGDARIVEMYLGAG